MKWLVRILGPELSVAVARHIHRTRRVITRLRRASIQTIASWTSSVRSAVGPKTLLSVAGALIAMVTVLMRTSAITTDHIVIMPFETHADAATPRIGEALAASLAI